MPLTICERCFPEWESVENFASAPILPCERCGSMEKRHVLPGLAVANVEKRLNHFMIGARVIYRGADSEALWKGDMCIVLECLDGKLNIWNRRTRAVCEGIGPSEFVE